MKKFPLLALSVLVLSASALNARADQCAYVTEAAATAAQDLIELSKKNAGGVLELCQPCGSREATKTKVNTVAIAATTVADVPSEVILNGNGIDLAYTYVAISKGNWVNLSKLVGCESHDVSQFILESKTRSGTKYKPSAVY